MSAGSGTASPRSTPYCHVEDVLRKFDPTLTAAQVRNGELGEDGLENVRSRIDEVSSQLERLTGHAWRERRVGHGTDTWEYHDADFRRFQNGLKVYLDHRHVLPLDSTAGDSLELRQSRQKWRNVLDGGIQYEMDTELGILHIYGRRRAISQPGTGDRALRVSYRYGSLGGSADRGGQTTLSASLAAGSTSGVAVENADRLPPDGIMLIGGEEYVDARVDAEAGELIPVRRGIRSTDDTDHDAGTIVHYVPPMIRSGVAAKTAVELVLYDDHVERLMETSESTSKRDKIETWEAEWDQLLGKEAEVRSI